MIRTLGPVPVEWDHTELLRRIDTDCYVQIEDTPLAGAVLPVMRVGAPDEAEALIDGDDLHQFLRSAPEKLAYIQYERRSDAVTCRALCGRNNRLLIEFGATMSLVRH